MLTPLSKKAMAIIAMVFLVLLAACGNDDNKASAPVDNTVVTVSPDAAAIADATNAQAQAIKDAAAALAAPAVAAPVAPASSVASCVSTTDANAAAKSDVQRVGGENCAYTLRVAAIGSTGVVCASGGWVCTLSFPDGVRVYKGDNKSFQGVIAGTMRFVAAYPQGDAVHDACALVGKEHRFGQAQNPPFPVTPGNFSC